MKLIKSTLLALAIITAFAPMIDVQAADGPRRNREITTADSSRELAFLLAPIKTKADLDRYLEELRQNPEARTPLNALSPAARDRFLNSLVFTERGLGGFYFADLEAQLTASQIYRVLSLFGAQHATALLKEARIESKADEIIMEYTLSADEPIAGDYQHYECVSRATCGPKSGYICMSSC